MDKRELNRRINGLKEAYPDKVALIEGIQDLLNRKIEVISEKNRQALRQFPMQFARRVSLGNGEWTTTLHMWADNLVDTLLDIDPLVLTCTDSAGYTVLHALVFAATGRFTQMVNYSFIKKMLDKNMSFVEMTVPNDVNSKVEGNAWAVKDVLQKTPMDYLVEFANGSEGEVPPDEQLQQMLYEFGNSPVTEAPVDNTPDAPVTDRELQSVEQATMQPGNPGGQPVQAGERQDLSAVQERQDEKDSGAMPTADEKEIQKAAPAAQAGAQEKHTEKESPILETLLGMI